MSDEHPYTKWECSALYKELGGEDETYYCDTPKQAYDEGEAAALRSLLERLRQFIMNIQKHSIRVPDSPDGILQHYIEFNAMCHFLMEEQKELGTPVTKVVNIHKKKGVCPPYDIYIGRATRAGHPHSKWHNPFSFRKYGEKCLELYEKHIRSRPDLLAALLELEDKVLGCWCKPGPCHGDVLVKLLKEKRGAAP